MLSQGVGLCERIRRVKRCGHVGGSASLGVGSKVSGDHSRRSRSLSAYVSGCRTLSCFSITMSARVLPCFHRDCNGLTSETVSRPPVSALFHKRFLAHSVFTAAIEQWLRQVGWFSLCLSPLTQCSWDLLRIFCICSSSFHMARQTVIIINRCVLSPIDTGLSHMKLLWTFLPWIFTLIFFLALVLKLRIQGFLLRARIAG